MNLSVYAKQANAKKAREAVAERVDYLLSKYYAYWTRDDGTKMTAMRRRGVKTGLQWEVIHPDARNYQCCTTEGLARVLVRYPDSYAV